MKEDTEKRWFVVVMFLGGGLAAVGLHDRLLGFGSNIYVADLFSPHPTTQRRCGGVSNSLACYFGKRG